MSGRNEKTFGNVDSVSNDNISGNGIYGGVYNA